MNVLDRKLFNRGARDELRRRGGINDTANYANGGGVLSNIFNYFRTPDEQNPMLQMAENVASSITPPQVYVDPEVSGLEQLEVDLMSNEERISDAAIRARVAESAERGRSAAEIANMVGKPVVEVLDILGGLALSLIHI